MASKLQPYAIGRVAEDSAEDSWEIEVFPVELYATYSGSLTNENKTTHSGESPFGESGSIAMTKDQRISCEWLPIYDPFLISPPQVFIGESVMIWKYDTLDKFFWTKINADFMLRKREKRTIWLSNQASSGTRTIDTGYYMTIDTMNKFVKLHTSNSDGESAGYDITINTQEGKISLSDTNGNNFELDSVSNKLTINTNNTVEVNTKEATVNTSLCTIKSDKCQIN